MANNDIHEFQRRTRKCCVDACQGSHTHTYLRRHTHKQTFTLNDERHPSLYKLKSPMLEKLIIIGVNLFLYSQPWVNVFSLHSRKTISIGPNLNSRQAFLRKNMGKNFISLFFILRREGGSQGQKNFFLPFCYML